MDEEVDLRHLLPQSWDFTDPETSYWMDCYRVWGVPEKDHPQQPTSLHLEGCTVVLLRGQPTFLPPAKLTVTETAQGFVLVTDRLGVATLEDGIYLLIVMPYVEPEARVRERAEHIAGLISIALGPNAVGRHEFTNIHEFVTPRTTSLGPGVLNPGAERPPTITAPHQDRLVQIDRCISRQPDAERSRLELAVRWYRLSFRDEGLDAFIAGWVALEALAMTGTNISELKRAIQLAYNLDPTQAERFRLGLIFDLRGKIVHHGHRPPVHSQLIRYVQALFVDVLLAHLGLEGERAAEAILNDSRFDPAEWLPQAPRTRRK